PPLHLNCRKSLDQPRNPPESRKRAGPVPHNLRRTARFFPLLRWEISISLSARQQHVVYSAKPDPCCPWFVRIKEYPLYRRLARGRHIREVLWKLFFYYSSCFQLITRYLNQLLVSVDLHLSPRQKVIPIMPVCANNRIHTLIKFWRTDGCPFGHVHSFKNAPLAGSFGIGNLPTSHIEPTFSFETQFNASLHPNLFAHARLRKPAFQCR